MPKKADQDEIYGVAEAKRRFETALLGARIAGPQHHGEPKPKSPKSPKKRTAVKKSAR